MGDAHLATGRCGDEVGGGEVVGGGVQNDVGQSLESGQRPSEVGVQILGVVGDEDSHAPNLWRGSGLVCFLH